MNEHTAPAIERHCDVVVIGGSAAGLAAALQLGRQRRSVIVVDAGAPRNAPAAHMHSFLGREGQPPGELTAAGRDEVRSYGGEVLGARAERIERTDDGRFRVALVGGHAVVARRVLAAIGLVDELPAVDGLAEQWGRGVVHCPFCHGYEVRDQRIVQLVDHPRALHTAPLFRQLTDRLTVLVDGDAMAPGDGGGGLDPAELDRLQAAGVEVVHGRASAVVSDGGHVVAVELADHTRIEADAVAVAPRFTVRADAFVSLGLELAPHATGLGALIETNELGETSVPGLYAAGNCTDPSQQVLAAAADGSRVAGMISFDLARDDVRAAARPSAGEADWDRRYGGDRMWSGNPNGSLVREVESLTVGRVLDVGAGEGGDALWLAEQGWQVTASDISSNALARVAAEADRRGLVVTCIHGDANGRDAFGAAAFDLVSAQYASIPRTPDDRAVHNMLRAVAPGGTLIVVSHDLEPMRAAIDPDTGSRPFDPDAYVRVDDVAAVLAASPAWEVEVLERRPRPPGAASASHHVDDIVLRARRRTD